MSNKPVNLVIEPWTTANTHFNLTVTKNEKEKEVLQVEYAGDIQTLSNKTPFINMIFNGKFDPEGGQTGNLVFNIKTPGYSFNLSDNGIDSKKKVGVFEASAILVKKTTCIVTLSLVESEKGSFSFNFDLKNNNDGKSHLFDPHIEIIRPPL